MTGSLQQIQRFVVLMLENRSFDHLFGFLKATNPQIEGIGPQQFSNLADPRNPQSLRVYASDDAGPKMPFDPPHEFCDVQKQLYGPDATGALCSATPANPAPMNGFLYVGAVAAQAMASGNTLRALQPSLASEAAREITAISDEIAKAGATPLGVA